MTRLATDWRRRILRARPATLRQRQPTARRRSARSPSSGGFVVLDSAHAGTTSGAGTGDPFAANIETLLTSTSAPDGGTEDTKGLKITNNFTVTGTFALAFPDDLRETFGIRLSDSVNASTPGHDALELSVRKGQNGVVQVQFRDFDIAAGTSPTNIASFNLDPSLANAGDKIALHLNHTAGSHNVSATFDILDSAGNPLQTGISLGSTSASTQIFNNVNWTRAQFVADAPQTKNSYLTGTYGTLSIDPQGDWSYALQNNSNAVKALQAGETVHDLFTIKVADGAGAFDTKPVDITVVGVNDAPALTISNPNLAAIDEDSAASTSNAVNPGQTVASILSAHVSDPDHNAVQGIVVAGSSPTHGTWQYSIDNGANWNDFGVYSFTSALLLAATDKVRFLGDGTQGGNDTFGFVAWDQTSGVHGTTVDISTRGGTTAFSQASDLAHLTVTDVNDAPVLDASQSPTFGSIPEDAGAPSGPMGNLVSTLVDLGPPFGPLGNVSDADSGAVTGIALVGVNTSQGTLWYSADNGANWVVMGGASDSAAILIPADSMSRLYYQPNAGVTGTISDAITIRAWDQTAGPVGTPFAIDRDGGSTAFSAATDTVSVTVAAAGNQAPVLASPATPFYALSEGGAVVVAPHITVSDSDSATLQGATVTIANADPDDFLIYVGPASIQASYSNGVMTLTGADTVANYQAALRSVLFLNTDINASVADRVITTVVDDGGSGNNLSNVLNSGIHIVTDRWIGGSGDWFNAAKWNNGVPTSLSDVVILANGARSSRSNSPSTAILALTLGAGAKLAMAAGDTLTVSQSLSNSGDIDPNFGGLTLDVGIGSINFPVFDFVNSGTIHALDGVRITGSLNQFNNSGLIDGESGDVEIGASSQSFSNDGQITGADISFTGSVAFGFNVGATGSITSGGDISLSGAIGGDFTNDGLIAAGGRISIGTVAGSFVNNDTMAAGAIDLADQTAPAVFQNNGDFLVSDPLLSTSMIGISVDNAGTFRVIDGASLQLNGSLQNSASVEVDTGSTLSVGGTLTVTGGTVIASGAGSNINLNSDVHLDGGSIQAIDGAYIAIGGNVTSAANTGAFLYIEAATLELENAVSADTVVEFQAITADKLVMDQPTSFDGTIEFFGVGALGDVIDMPFAENAVIDSYDAASGVLHFHFDNFANTGIAAAVTFSGNYVQDNFGFVDDGHGGTEIRFDQPVALGPTQLVATPDIANDSFYWPSFSPDGSELAFWHNSSPDDEIVIKSLTGGQDFFIDTGLSSDGDNSPITFSHDGGYVAFGSADDSLANGAIPSGTNAIYLAGTASGSLTLISTDGNGDPLGESTMPIFSPTDDKLAFWTFDSGTSVWDLVLKDYTSGALTTLFDGPINFNFSAPAFSADGSTVTFSAFSDNANGERIYLVPVDTPQNVSELQGFDAGNQLVTVEGIGSVLSADGHEIAFLSQMSGLASGEVDGEWNFFVENLDTQQIQWVANGGTFPAFDTGDREIVFSPDGTKVAFNSAASLVAADTNGANDLYVKDLNNGTFTLVSSTPSGDAGSGDSFDPAFSPDGTLVAFDSFATDLVGQNTGGNESIFIRSIGDDAPVTSPVTLAAIAEDFGARLITQAELLANASDVDGPSLTAVNLQIATGQGSLADNHDGTWSYTPALNDDSGVTFSYQVTDGTQSAAGSASLDITPVDDAPAIDDDLQASVALGSSVVLTTGDLTAVDPDTAPDQLTFNVVNPVNGHIELNGVQATSFTQQDLAGGLVSFVQSGPDNQHASFAVTLSDGIATTPLATTVNLTVTTAIINILTPNGFSFQDEDLFGAIGEGDIESQSAAQFVVVNAAADRRFVFDGDFTYDAGNVPHGTVTTLHASTDDAAPVALYDIAGRIDATSLYNTAQAEAAGDFRAGEELTRNWSIRFVGNDGADAFESGDNNDFFQGGGGNDTLTGDAGLDRANYRQATGPIAVTLGLAGDSTGGTVVGTGANASGVGTDSLSSIEFVTGTNYADTFDATLFSETSQVPGVSGTSNEFEGAGGDDTITGNGDTRISYLHATSAVNVNLTTGIATGDASVGTDHFTGVNRVRGSNFDDTLIGSNNPANTTEFFEGRGGDDAILGGGGIDAAVYNQSYSGSGINVHLAAGTVTPLLPIGQADIGNDTLSSVEIVLGTDYNDTYDATGFSGSSTNAGSSGTFNQFEGGGGDDTITGNGNTRISYSSALDGVRVTLGATGSAVELPRAYSNIQPYLDTFDPSHRDPADVGFDNVISGVNRVRGSAYADRLTGNTGNNILEGQGGDDILSGSGGSDTLIGGSGADIFGFSSGATTITDFDQGEGAFNQNEADRIDLRNFGIASFSALSSKLSEDASHNSIITTSAGNTITLTGVANAQLQARDFIFSGYIDLETVTPNGFDFGLLYDGLAGADPALSAHDATHYVVANPDAGFIVSLISSGTFTYDANGNPTGGNVSAISINDASSYVTLAGGSGFNFSLTSFLSAVQTYAGSQDPSALDAILLNNVNVHYSLVGSEATTNGGASGGDTFLASINADFFDGRTNANGDNVDGDTVDYSHTSGAGVTVDLSITAAQNTGGSGADTLLNIENLRGTSFNDHLTGNGSDNVLEGGQGDDIIDGGAGGGINTASYEHAPAMPDGVTGVTVNLNLQGGTQNTVTAGNDTLINISSLRGSDHNDTLIGDNNVNNLAGGKGDDVLTGNGGQDYFVFAKGDGNDIITDFTQGQDQIELDNLFDGPNDTHFQQLLADLHNAANGDHVIHLNGGTQTITLTGVNVNALNVNDFVVHSGHA